MIILVAVYVSLGVLNLWTWDKHDDKIFKSHSAIQGVYVLASLVLWPIFLAMRAWRFLRGFFTEDVFPDKL